MDEVVVSDTDDGGCELVAGGVAEEGDVVARGPGNAG